MNHLPRLVFLFGLLLIAVAGFAGPAPPTIVLDGQILQTAQPPVMRDASLLLPMRDVFQALQATVLWFVKERKIEARHGETLLEMWLGTPVAMVNHTPVQLNTPPVLINGQAYVPLRLVAEGCGGVVRWDALTRTAFIYSPGPR